MRMKSNKEEMVTDKVNSYISANSGPPYRFMESSMK